MRRRFWHLLGAAVGAVVVALLVRSLGVASIAVYLRELGPGFGLVLVAYLAANTIYALPLGLLLPADARPRPASLVASRLAAAAVSAATPFLGIGGEPARLLWLPPSQRRVGLAGVVMDRSAYLSATSVCAALGAWLAVLTLRLPLVAKVGLAVVGSAAPPLALILYAVQRSSGVARPVARLVGLFAGRRGQALSDGASDVDLWIRGFHRARPGRFCVAATLHLCGRVVGSLEVFAAARLIGLHLGVRETVVLAAAPLSVDLVLAMVPSQIGFQEGALALLASALGYEPAAGVALSLVLRLRQLFFVTLGFLLLLLRPPPPAARQSSATKR